jgi:hypothetical protein
MADAFAPASVPARVWGFMYALGTAGPPQRVGVGDRTLQLERLVKHDFWAATAFYLDAESGRRAVLKFGRIQPLLWMPTRWIGRLLAGRESHFYQRLADLAAVPNWLGIIDRPWIGFAHEYAPGRPLSEMRNQRVEGRFFEDLADLLSRMHERGIAYVDLHKPQNVLIDDDHRPHLIDFQISYDIDFGLKKALLPRFVRAWALRAAVRADWYHFLKHKQKFRPDLLSEPERRAVHKRLWFIHAHRALISPYRFVRRRLMNRWRRSGRLLPQTSK